MIPWQVKKLKVLPGHRLEVAFADGLSGVVDLSKDHFDGVLAPLADEVFFAQARPSEVIHVPNEQAPHRPRPTAAAIAVAPVRARKRRRD